MQNREFKDIFKVNAQDLEIWIRHCLDQHRLQHGFRVEKEYLDNTEKRVRLYFTGKFYSPKYSQTPSIWGVVEMIEWSGGETEILFMRPYPTPIEDIRFYKGRFTSAEKNYDEIMAERVDWLDELFTEIKEKFDAVESRAQDAKSPREYAGEIPMPRVPKNHKSLNNWKACWRKIKAAWKGGATYKSLAKIGRLHPDTIADIVKAGDAGLLD